MAVNIKFDLAGNPEAPTLVLANRNGNKLGQLSANEESIELIDKFNGASEISFTVNKYIDGKITNLWDKLVDFRLIYCKEWDCWFECKVELDEATESVKTVFCTQLGQAELSQIMLYDIEINTEKDIERDDYVVGTGVFYNPIDSRCILSRLLDKAPHYSIIHVDETLWNIQRSFSFDSTSIYDAFQEVAEEIGCLFVFNSDSDENGMPQRTISVYDLQQNCKNKDCKYRGEFTDKCPKCGNTDITSGYGEDTLIFVTSDELASEGIQLITDTESVKNCFKLEAGDDLMTATIRNRNPNGTDYIWYFSDATKEDMPNELVEKIEEYDDKYRYYYSDYESSLDATLLRGYNSLVDAYLKYNEDLEKVSNPVIGFSSLMQAYYNVIDLGWYLKSGLMPTVKMAKTNAEEQGLLLQVSLPALIAVTNLDIVSRATADSTILAMAKAIVNSHYKVAIVDKSSQLVNGRWSGKFVITNYSDDEDTYTTGVVSRSLTDWDETYIKQKIDKILSKENTDDLSITGLFEKEYDEFCTELKKYALTPLTSFHDACYACIDILIEQGVGDVNNDLYEKLYIPYYDKLKAIEAEMKIRESEINIIIDLQTDIEKIKATIQKELNFENYLGKDLWLQFCAYRREDKYSNPNYISDGLNNAELFERALQFYEVAENEIFKSSELQHSITATLNNLLAIPKFKPLVKSFKVGNWIRVLVDGFVYKLRLIEYEISYKDFNSISVEFSDVTKTKNGYSDLENILSDASSMASSYDSIQRQANLGNEARDMIRQWMNEGLDASLTQIKNNTNEDIVIDNNGLIGRSYSDITEEYSPEQIRLTHNIIAFTDDGWNSVKQAIGKHKYKYYDEGKKNFIDAVGYGMSADFVTAGIVSGSQIIGGNIYSDNYQLNKTGSYINLRDGTFDFGGGRITFNGKELNISSPDIMTEDQVTKITNDTIATTNIIAKNLQVNAANVNGKLTAAEIDASKITSGTINAERLDLSGVATIENLRTGKTVIDGGCIQTGEIDANLVKIKNLEVDVSGSISFKDLSDYEIVADSIDTANNIASEAYDTLNDITYSDGVKTYIDESCIMSGTVIAGSLQGGEIILLDRWEDEAACFTLQGASSWRGGKLYIESGAIELKAYGGDIYFSNATDVVLQLSTVNQAVVVGHGDLIPSSSGMYDLGTFGFTWNNLYVETGQSETSDRNKKNTIEELPEKYINMMDNVSSKRFKLNSGTSDRFHVGFIAQEVESAMVSAGIDSKEFGGLVKDIDGDGNDVYMLRYSEFISILHAKNKQQDKRLNEMSLEIENLKNKIIELEKRGCNYG